MYEEERMESVMPKQKHVALVAHDHKRNDLVAWCNKNKEELKGHFLCGTGTTAKMITEATGLPVTANNQATADFLIASHYMTRKYRHAVMDYERTMIRRMKDIRAEIEETRK